MVPSIAGLLRWPRRRRHSVGPPGDVQSHRLSYTSTSPDLSPSKKTLKKIKLGKTLLRKLSPMPARRAKPDEEPRLGCYLCGQHVPSSTLLDHITDCLSSWNRREAIKPPDERVPLPPSPKELMEAFPKKPEDVERFNKHMRSIWLKATNRKCVLCNKTMKAGAYYRHMKIFHVVKDEEVPEESPESPVEETKQKKTKRASMKSFDRSSRRSIQDEAGKAPVTPTESERSKIEPPKRAKKLSIGSRRGSFGEKKLKAKEIVTPKSAKTARSPLDLVETSAASVKKLRSQSFNVPRPRPCEIGNGRIQEEPLPSKRSDPLAAKRSDGRRSIPSSSTKTDDASKADVSRVETGKTKIKDPVRSPKAKQNAKSPKAKQTDEAPRRETKVKTKEAFSPKAKQTESTSCAETAKSKPKEDASSPKTKPAIPASRVETAKPKIKDAASSPKTKQTDKAAPVEPTKQKNGETASTPKAKDAARSPKAKDAARSPKAKETARSPKAKDTEQVEKPVEAVERVKPKPEAQRSPKKAQSTQIADACSSHSSEDASEQSTVESESKVAPVKGTENVPVVNIAQAPIPPRRKKKDFSHEREDAEVKSSLQNLRKWGSVSERVQSKKADSSDRCVKPQMDRSASFTASGPRGYTCYLCGRQFGSASLSIHQRQCRQLWEDREALKRKKSERRPLPTPPPEMSEPLPTDREGILAFNNAMFKFWESRSLISCPYCARTFTEEAFEKHQRVCTESNPGGPLGLSKYRQKSYDVNASATTTKAKEHPEWDSRPTQYCCYLCGRQYGRQSLFLHVPRCQKLWEDREATKPKKQQRALPPPPPELEGFPDVTLPTDPEEVLAFNNAVYAYWDRVSLYVCSCCGRSFNEESFEKHQRLCNGAGAKPGMNKKSPTKKLPKENGRTTAGDNSELPKPPSMPKYYVCFLCGRQFGSKSLLIHVPYCEKQWTADEERKPKGQRRPLPPRPEQIQTSTLPSHAEEIAAFNAAMLSYWEKNTLLECKTCGRTFNSEAYEKHQRHCKDSHARRANP